MQIVHITTWANLSLVAGILQWYRDQGHMSSFLISPYMEASAAALGLKKGLDYVLPDDLASVSMANPEISFTFHHYVDSFNRAREFVRLCSPNCSVSMSFYADGYNNYVIGAEELRRLQSDLPAVNYERIFLFDRDLPRQGNASRLSAARVDSKHFVRFFKTLTEAQRLCGPLLDVLRAESLNPKVFVGAVRLWGSAKFWGGFGLREGPTSLARIMYSRYLRDSGGDRSTIFLFRPDGRDKSYSAEVEQCCRALCVSEGVKFISTDGLLPEFLPFDVAYLLISDADIDFRVFALDSTLVFSLIGAGTPGRYYFGCDLDSMQTEFADQSSLSLVAERIKSLSEDFNSLIQEGVSVQSDDGTLFLIRQQSQV